MKESLFSRRDEQVELAEGALPAIDPSPLLGRWINTYTSTEAIASITISRVDRRIVLRLSPANASAEAPWHEAAADAIYAGGVRSSTATAVTATFRSTSMITRLEANLNLGLLVVVTFHRFTDDSDRSNYFLREFFHRADDASTQRDREVHAWTP